MNVKQLATKFQLLQPEDLLELVKLVKANQTPDMYVLEDGEGKLDNLEAFYSFYY